MLQEELGISDDEFDDIQSLFQVHYMLHIINHFMGMVGWFIFYIHYIYSFIIYSYSLYSYIFLDAKHLYW